jgi:hypothetical protein
MVDLIVAALAAGATAGVSGTATDAVKDAYELLKALIRRRFTGRDTARAALDADEIAPGLWLAGGVRRGMRRVPAPRSSSC